MQITAEGKIVTYRIIYSGSNVKIKSSFTVGYYAFWRIFNFCNMLNIHFGALQHFNLIIL